MSATEDIARLRSDVLSSVRAVPSGFVTTHEAIAATLDVLPRHVAHILANLADAERAEVPWHRVVAVNGRLEHADADNRNLQEAALNREGIGLDPDGRIENFLDHLTQIIAVTRVKTPPVRRDQRG